MTGAAPASQAGRVCNICGGTLFVPGFNGRMPRGLAPSCAGCQSSERHRIARSVLEPLTPLLQAWRALHFAPDGSVDPAWFKDYRSSTYGSADSLDMMATGLPDGAYDMVLSNHVLEHVPDYVAAVRETLRVTGPAGLVQAMVPARAWRLEDWGFADPAKNAHYREFGTDFGIALCAAVTGAHAIGVAAPDPVTDEVDIVYLISQSEATLRRCGERLIRQWRFAVVRFG